MKKYEYAKVNFKFHNGIIITHSTIKEIFSLTNYASILDILNDAGKYGYLLVDKHISDTGHSYVFAREVQNV